MIGYVAYADRFAGDLAGVGEHIDYLTGLGVKYLHIMPFLQPRDGANDGGYAVADYRKVRSDLGTMDDLERLTKSLRENGISLVMDLVLNHVAKEHEWAEAARRGEPRYRDYFIMFPDREMPDQYERSLPEIFPDFAPGNFTWNDEAGQWVWTTFNEYQWDLNWANPDVLYEFVELICWLANKGVDVFRLDAIAFIWKRMGTNCQNQPEVHDLTQVLRGCLRIAAPAVAFKAEAIVAPEDLMPYLGVGHHYGLVSDMAYHNELMVQLWNSLATGGAEMAQVALAEMPLQPTSAVRPALRLRPGTGDVVLPLRIRRSGRRAERCSRHGRGRGRAGLRGALPGGGGAPGVGGRCCGAETKHEHRCATRWADHSRDILGCGPRARGVRAIQFDEPAFPRDRGARTNRKGRGVE